MEIENQTPEIRIEPEPQLHSSRPFNGVLLILGGIFLFGFGVVVGFLISNSKDVPVVEQTKREIPTTQTETISEVQPSPTPLPLNSPIPTPTPLDSEPEIDPLDQSTWERFHFEKMGFSISAPAGTLFTVGSRSFGGESRYSNGNSINYTPTSYAAHLNPKKLNISGWFKEYSPPSADEIEKFEYFTVDGHEAVKFRLFPKQPLHFFVNAEDKIISISVVDSGDEENVNRQDQIRTLMVESIQFD